MTKNSASPRVFVSHASEDEKSFVLGFCEKLREQGIDAWFDKWELSPGDSLVDRIFEEGIGESSAFIVVLSKNSVDKPWVREELNAGVVKRINEKSKLIPVVIDDCEDQLPAAVRHLVWHRVHSLENYDADVDRIVMAIHGYLEKPPLGEAPEYARLRIDVIPQLEPVDSLVLKTACDKTMERDDKGLGSYEIVEALASAGVAAEQVRESLEILDGRGYVKIRRLMAGPSKDFGFQVTTLGMDEYLRVFMPDYDDVFRSVGLRLVNEQDGQSEAIREAVAQPRVIVDHILDKLEQGGYVRAQTVAGGNRFIFNVSPELKRLLEAA